MDETARRLCSISEDLFAKKKPWDSWCQDIANNFYPMRADFTRTLRLGDDFATGTLDGTTIQTRETLGNAIDSMLRQGPWFKMGTGDEGRDKKQDNALALDYGTQQLRRIIGDRRSNWDRAVKEADQDWVTFGQPTLSVEYNPVGHHLVHRAWHPRDIATMQDQYGVIDTVHRNAPMQARHIKARFDSKQWSGELHNNIIMACEKAPSTEFKVRHILMPMDEVYGSDPKKVRQLKSARFVSMYIDLDHNCLLNEAPSHVFNYLVPRWRTLDTHPQGFSPLSINSLPDARMLQNMAMVIIEQGQKAVDPPIIGSGEAFTRDINMYSGGFTYIDLPDGMKLGDIMTTVDTSQGLQAGLELKQDVRELITEGWLLNKLFLPDLQQMTAYEASVRTEEFRRAALPFFTPIQSEYHSPLLGLDFEMAVHVGLVDASAFPPDLQGTDVVFQFNSPLEEAEGQQKVAAFQQSMQIIAASSQIDNTVAKLFDIHTATIDAVRGSGAEADWILPPDQLEAAKKQAADDKQNADLAQKYSMASQVAANLSGGVMAARQAGLLKGPPGAMPPGAGAMPGAAPAAAPVAA